MTTITTPATEAHILVTLPRDGRPRIHRGNCPTVTRCLAPSYGRMVSFRLLTEEQAANWRHADECKACQKSARRPYEVPVGLEARECGAIADPRRESRWITDPVCHQPAGHSGTHVCTGQRGEREGFIFTTPRQAHPEWAEYNRQANEAADGTPEDGPRDMTGWPTFEEWLAADGGYPEPEPTTTVAALITQATKAWTAHMLGECDPEACDGEHDEAWYQRHPEVTV